MLPYLSALKCLSSKVVQPQLQYVSAAERNSSMSVLHALPLTSHSASRGASRPIHLLILISNHRLRQPSVATHTRQPNSAAPLFPISDHLVTPRQDHHQNPLLIHPLSSKTASSSRSSRLPTTPFADDHSRCLALWLFQTEAIQLG